MVLSDLADWRSPGVGLTMELGYQDRVSAGGGAFYLFFRFLYCLLVDLSARDRMTVI